MRDARYEVLCPLTSALELHRNLLYIKPRRIEQAFETVHKVFTLYPLVMPLAEDVLNSLTIMARFMDQDISLYDAITAQMAK